MGGVTHREGAATGMNPNSVDSIGCRNVSATIHPEIETKNMRK